MLSLVEELVLLTLDDESGSFLSLPEASLQLAVGGAVLLDLALRDRIDSDLQKVRVVDRTPTGDPILDPVLAKLCGCGEVLATTDWIWELSKLTEIREQALDRLVERGVLRREDKKVLWVFGTRRYPEMDGVERREVKERLSAIVLGHEIPDPRDVVLVCLLHGCSLFPSVFPIEDVNAAWDRIRWVAGLDLMGKQILDLMSDLQDALYRGKGPRM